MRAGRLLLLSLLGSIGMAGPARASDADEVPAFLRRPIRTVEEAEETAPADSEEDPLRELMKRVRVGGEESEGSFFSIQTGDESIQTGDEDPAEDEAPREIAQEEESVPYPDPVPAPPPAERPAEDPCGELRTALREREDYLRRVAAERDAYAWVENPRDAQALRLLQSLRRCAEHPEDEDCRPPPIERRLEELEPPRHVYERWPSELEAEGKEPDAVPHDPVTLDLLHRLEQCERRRNPQPLLGR
jgi:hypothetical protein